MPDYRLEKTKELEDRGLSLIKAMGFGIEANNIGNNDIDYRIKKNKNQEVCNDKMNYFYVDFQYSADFVLYGDIRIDIVSAYDPSSLKLSLKDIKDALLTSISQSNQLSVQNLQYMIQNIVNVNKFGKLFDENLNSIIFFIFNKKDNEIKKDDIPDIIAIIPRKTIIKFIKKFPELFAKNIKFNHKNNVGDSHGSAFIAIPLSALYAIEPFFVIYTQELKNTLLTK